ncbi:STAS domain-containing protein [Thermanaerovibrio acidaminovorans]|jgi:anti-sigma B factor antagonist|uniref:STAS domain-containing protein n=1 Tax=Thermanaerovibrio acidaminovorans TaxID=81462 RepID=UPI00249332AA|nr:STAS domain-containing protein [Thermanaerovibrio acidaminovorans]
MGYNITAEGQKATVAVRGHLYVEDVADMKARIFDEIANGVVKFQFDLTDLNYIDSAGLGLLISIQKRVIPLGGRVTVTGAQGLVLEIFELTRLDRVFFPR